MDYWGIYDWTWGEVVDYVDVCNERQRRRMQDLSSVAFSLAGTVSTLMSGSGGQVSLIDEFGQFWTAEERREIKIQKIFDSLMSQTSKIENAGKEVAEHASG